MVSTDRKTLVYVGVGALVLLLVGAFSLGRMNGNVVSSVSGGDSMAGHHGGGGQQISVSGEDSMAGHHGGGGQQISLSGEEIAKYRSEDIPADCRLPDYDDDVAKWVEHLGHHQETQFCLEYYGGLSTSRVSDSSLGVPEKCRQPVGRDRDSWVEHLGHHQETKECLKYFE